MRNLILSFFLLCLITFISCGDSATGPDPGNNGNGEGQTYSVEVTANPSGGGTVSPSASETYQEGEEIEIQADPNEEYLFTNWTGDVEGSDNPLSLTVDQDYSITANFEVKNYELTVNTEGEGTVSESVLNQKSKDYEHGTVVELTANPADGWTFVEWQGDTTGTENPAQITVDGAKEVTAVFEKKSYQLKVNTNGEGAVSESIIQQKQKDYEFGTVVEMEANPANGWEFVKWQGEVTGSENPSQITIDSPKEVTAVFEKKNYSLSTNTNGKGSVAKNPDQQTFAYESTVELEANPDDGWMFVEWTGDISAQQNPVEVTVDADKEVTAVFEKKNYDLTVNTEGQGSVDEKVVNNNQQGTVVELTADPADGWTFVGWQGFASGTENPVQVTVDGARKVTAVFEQKVYPLTVNQKGEGAISESIVQRKATNYKHGTVVELEATPANGWSFKEWQGDITGNENPSQVTVRSPKEVTAVFERNGYSLIISTTGGGNVTKTPDQESYAHNSTVELKANPTDGSTFVKWQGDVTGTENPIEITMDGDKNVTAVIEKKGYPLTVQTEGEGRIIKTPDRETYPSGENVSVRALPADGWTFVKWKGALTGTENPQNITFDEAKDLTAVFEKKSYPLTIEVNGEGAVSETVIQQKTTNYKDGTVVELKANPANGWKFNGWQYDLSGTENPIRITVDEPKSVLAGFTKKSYTLTTNTTGEGAVNKSPNQQNYLYNTTVELTAEPLYGWQFVEWSGDTTGTENPIDVTMDEDKKFTAVFEEANYTVSVDTSGKGTVTKAPDQETYTYNAGVELEATPAKGWKFIEWKGDVTDTENPTEFYVRQDKEVTAVFEKKTYPLTINTTGEGSVTKSPDQETYAHNSMVDLTANPASGWKFIEWQGDLSGSEKSAQITMDGAKEVTAVFEKKSYQLTVNTTGEGSVTKSPDQETYAYNTTVELAANPSDGWQLTEWQGDLTGSNNPAQIKMDSDKEITAVFEETNFHLAENGVTIKCDDANVGTTGTINGVTYTKRTADQINYANSSTTCTSGITNMDGLFNGSSLRDKDITHWDVSSVTSMNKMFNDLGSYFREDLTHWDVSNVTDMTRMFGSVSFDISMDFSSWDVSSVTSMEGMFESTTDRGPVGSGFDFGGSIKNWDVSNVEDMSSMFRGSSYNGDISSWNVANVTDMAQMFQGARYFNGNISGWNVSRVTNMKQMFKDAQAFNKDLNNWDVSNVTNMKEMFSGFDMTFNGDITNWDVGNVTTMESMFAVAEFFNRDIGSWDVSSVTNMKRMFYLAKSFNQDLNSWDVSNVTTMEEMFSALNGTFNGDISDWDVGNVTNMRRMFYTQESFNSDLSNWDVSNVTNMERMFYRAISFNSDIGNWNVSSVTDMRGMFFKAKSFNQDINSWDVSNVPDMINLFNLATSFNQDLNNWDVSNVTRMSGMFSGASSFNGDIGTWDVSNVTDMGDMFSMFDVSSSFDQDLNNWDVSSVTDFTGMFFHAESFNGNISNWNTSSAKNMHLMFSGARAFNSDIGGWDVSNVTNMRQLFQLATSFNQDLNNWDVYNVTNMIDMFSEATSFNGKVNDWDVSNVTTMRRMFRKASSFNQPLNNWDVSNVQSMRLMFDEASSFNQDLNSWDISQGPDVAGMFQEALAFNGDIGSWDVSNVSSMEAMFSRASSFNQDLNNWDVSNVTTMRNMFFLAESFNGDISDWNPHRVRDVSNIFYGASSFNRDIGGWEFVFDVDMRYMFYDASVFNQDLSGWCVEHYSEMPEGFVNPENYVLQDDYFPVWGTCPGE